jgi:dipeptidyl aminopeptidase/acylaminoacyl peptidase
MKYLSIYLTLVVMLVFLFASERILAQKPAIDTSAYGKLSTVGAAYLSNNGAFIYYESYSKKGRRVSIKGIQKPWEKDINNVKSQAFFANGNQLLITKCGQDSLCLQTLGSDQVEFIPHVGSFEVSNNGKAQWLTYTLDSPGNELILRDLATGTRKLFSNITAHQFSAGDQAMVLQQQSGDSPSLGWLNLAKDTIIPIWRGKTQGNFKFSFDGKKMAFIGSTAVPDKNALWYYNAGDEKASMVLTEDVPDSITCSLKLEYLLGFNNTGEKLFFTLQLIDRKPGKKSDPKLASLDIYSYKDVKLQSQQLKQLPNSPPLYTYAFDLQRHKLMALEKQNERLTKSMDDFYKGAFVLARAQNGDDRNEWNWNPATLTSVYLLSLVDGTRKYLCRNQPYPVSSSFRLSPDGKYVVYYDAVRRDYFSYDISSGITRNITKGAGEDWIGEFGEDMPDSVYRVEPDYRWAINDQAVFIHTKNDIYQADPSGKLPVIRLTGNYGQIRHLQFRFADLHESTPSKIKRDGPLLLKVLDNETGDEGYCKVTAGQENNPVILEMIPYHLDRLQKARDTAVYTVQLESAESSPNQVLTMDFKTFTPLTDNHPEKRYNWITAQLVQFKTLEGKTTKGILFKPENFDPKKKYPIIFEYYERNVVGLHRFASPGYTDGSRLDIPTYVSNGYLVFAPDIHYKVGYPGKSACNAIIGAANYIMQFPWVDKRHMGLMGHSFGGFETNYVITHSHLFAAAVSMSGMTDFVSAYGSIVGDGTSRQRQYEIYRDRIGYTLWQRADLYLENSPILKADQITTPVLLMANKKDDDVPYEQGVEFFTALRRLGKKAWMLQYDDGGHQVFDAAGQKDLTIRIAQFFNYYLKNAQPPRWMTVGIPAIKKGIDPGFDLDSSRTTP